MKNLFRTKILDEVNQKIEDLENSFVDISWTEFQQKTIKSEDIIGLYAGKRAYLKKTYTFSPL